MNVAFTFKNFEASEHLKKYAQRRFEKLAWFVENKDNLEIHVILSIDRFRQKTEVVLTADNVNISAMEESDDMYSSIDLVQSKLETQLKKHNDKLKEQRRIARNAAHIDVFAYHTEGEGEERSIVGSDQFVAKPLLIDEAALQLENLDYEFLVFLNAETERINVMYRRRNGDFGLIDPVV